MTSLAAYASPADLEPEPVRLAQLLDLEDEAGSSDLALADRVAQGLPYRSAYALQPLLSRIRKDALHAFISESTLRRAKLTKSSLKRETSERLYELGRVIDQAAKVFHGNEAAVARFLDRPNPLLQGRKPFDVARASSAGAVLVVKLLREADAGVAV